MTHTRQNQSVNIATAGVALIAIVAFIISYSALQRTAAAYGFPGWQSWLWPLLIDMPILVFAFTSLVIGWMTNRRSWFATSMIVLFSGATIMFNLAHAEMHWLHYAVAVMPPLALIVSFEALRELIQIVAVQQLPAPETMQPIPAPDTAPPATAPPVTEPPLLETEPEPVAKSETVTATRWAEWDSSERYMRISAWREAGLTWSQIATEAGATASAVKSWWSRNQPELATGKNGGGLA